MRYELLKEDIIPQDESNIGYLGRTGARTLARAGESIIGLPGDVASGLIGLTNYGISKATGKPGPIPDIPLPTSEAIRRNITKPLTGEYLEPQGRGEKFYDEIIGDAAALLVPLKGKVPFAKAAMGALAKSAVGNIAKWGAEEVTGSPLVGIGAKIGSMALAGTLGGRKVLTDLKTKSYDEAFSKIPKNIKFDLSPEKNKLQKLANTISRGDRPDKAFMLDRLHSINNITNKSGTVSLEEAINLKQDWNKYLSDPSLPKSSRDGLKQAVGIINDGIKRYGSTNPSFYNPYKIAEELTGALQSTNYMQKVLAKHPYLQDSIKNPLLQKALWGGALYGVSKVPFPTVAAIGAGAYGIKESAKLYQLLSKSPIARKYYKEVVESALKNDIKAVRKNLSKLDNSANQFSKKYPEFNEEQETPKGRYEFVS